MSTARGSTSWSNGVSRYGNPRILESMGILENVNDLLRAAGLATCLAPRPTYLRFVLEFFSTLETRADSTSCQNKVYSISFQLLNKSRTLRHAEIGRIYGFQQQNVQDSASLGTFQLQQFWGQITTASDTGPPPTYDARTSRLTSIRNPVVKYLQKLLGATLCARKELSSPRQYELEILWAIVDRRLRDSQEDLMKCFQKVVKEAKVDRQKETKVPDPIYCGALITPILEHFDIPLPAFKPISDDYFLSWGDMEILRIAVQGFRKGSSGPSASYVLQNEGHYLCLPNFPLHTLGS